jgi:hypothetical protein
MHEEGMHKVMIVLQKTDYREPGYRFSGQPSLSGGPDTRTTSVSPAGKALENGREETVTPPNVWPRRRNPLVEKARYDGLKVIGPCTNQKAAIPLFSIRDETEKSRSPGNAECRWY